MASGLQVVVGRPPGHELCENEGWSLESTGKLGRIVRIA